MARHFFLLLGCSTFEGGRNASKRLESVGSDDDGHLLEPGMMGEEEDYLFDVFELVDFGKLTWR